MVQVLGDDASDASLAVFLFSDLDQVVGPLRITETGEGIIVSPRPLPMIFVTICVLVPAAIAAVVLVREALGGITAFTVIGMVMLPLALISVLGILYLLNRHLLSKGDYLRANIARRLVELPRAGITLAREQVVELIQVDGWKTDVSERWHRYELSALVRASDGLRRYPLAVGAKRDIVRLSDRLSSLMGCRVRQIHL